MGERGSRLRFMGGGLSTITASFGFWLFSPTPLFKGIFPWIKRVKKFTVDVHFFGLPIASKIIDC